MKKLLIIMSFVVAFVMFSASAVFAEEVTFTGYSNVTEVVDQVKTNVSLVKTTINNIKSGGWDYVIGNVVGIVLLLIGASRVIAKALIFLMQLLMKLTPDNVDNILTKIIKALTKFLEVASNLFGWISLTFGNKGTNTVKTGK